MKDYKKLLVVVLILFQVLGWYGMASWIKTTTSGVSQLMAQADAKAKEGLYQQALIDYDTALAEKDTLEIRLGKVAVYQAYIKAEPDKYSIQRAMEQELTSLLADYPKEAKAYETVAQYYYDTEEYVQAIENLNRAEAVHVSSKTLTTLATEMQYLTGVSKDHYAAFLPYVNGYYVVSDGESWRYVTADGEDLSNETYQYAGRFSEVAFVKAGTENRLIDEKSLTLAILDASYQKAGLFAEGVIPLYNGTTWDYVTKEGEKAFGGYHTAGTFYNKLAAVQKEKGGLWQIIDDQDKEICKPEYQEIALNFAGRFNQSDVMLAKKDGVFRIYQIEKVKEDVILTPIESFSAVKVAGLADKEIFAYSDGKQWGFADITGKVVIEPCFDQARPYSNGYAAVCKDEKWGFITIDSSKNKAQNVIDYTYEDVGDFNSKQTCMVKENGEWRLLHFLVDEAKG